MAGTSRASPPMYFPPTTFTLPDVVTCAGLVVVAYDQYSHPTQPEGPIVTSIARQPSLPLGLRKPTP
jgi:hypothetical protein